MQSSVIDAQDAFYGKGKGPPILPHSDDRDAALFLQELKRKCQERNNNKKKQKQYRDDSTTGSSADTVIDPELKQMFPASQLPKGFPPELAYRALAAFSTIRTLSITLRLSPFTPNVFLRALYLPYPTRLLGHIHVAILRILLPALHMGYHWSNSISTKKPVPPLNVVKKRKHDNLRWTLRAGDNLEYLDHFTWPVFFDDYAHLTADLYYASWHSTTNQHHDNSFIDMKNLDVSMIPSDLVPGEHPSVKLAKIGTAAYNRSSRYQESRAGPSIIYLDGSDDDDDEEDEINKEHSDDEDEFKDDGAIPSDDEMDVDYGSAKKRKRGRPRKSLSKKAKVAASSSRQQTSQYHQQQQQPPNYLTPQQRQQLFFMQQHLFQQQQQHLARGNVQQALVLQNLQRQQAMQFHMQVQRQQQQQAQKSTGSAASQMATVYQNRKIQVPQLTTMTSATAKQKPVAPPRQSTKPIMPPAKKQATPPTAPVSHKVNPTVIISNGRKIETNSPFLPYSGELNEFSQGNPPTPTSSTTPSKVPASQSSAPFTSDTAPSNVSSNSSDAVKQVQMERTVTKGTIRASHPVVTPAKTLTTPQEASLAYNGSRPDTALPKGPPIKPLKPTAALEENAAQKIPKAAGVSHSEITNAEPPKEAQESIVAGSDKDALPENDTALSRKPSTHASHAASVPDSAKKTNSLSSSDPASHFTGDSTTEGTEKQSLPEAQPTENLSTHISASNSEGETKTKPAEGMLTQNSSVIGGKESTNPSSNVVLPDRASKTFDTSDGGSTLEKNTQETAITPASRSKEAEMHIDTSISADGKSKEQRKTAEPGQQSQQLLSKAASLTQKPFSTAESATADASGPIQPQSASQTIPSVPNLASTVYGPQRVLNLVFSLSTQQILSTDLTNSLPKCTNIAPRKEVERLSGVKASTFPVVLSQLKKKELIEYDTGHIRLTDQGVQKARIVNTSSYVVTSLDQPTFEGTISKDALSQETLPSSGPEKATVNRKGDSHSTDSVEVSEKMPVPHDSITKQQLQPSDEHRTSGTSVVQKDLAQVDKKGATSNSSDQATVQTTKASLLESPTHASENDKQEGPSCSTTQVSQDSTHFQGPSPSTPSKVQQSSKDDCQTSEGNDSKQSTKSKKKSRAAVLSEVVDRSSDWPHFFVLQAMRSGTPYHRLTVEEKLDLLEYLIDDLLSLDYIAAEMNRRHEQNGHLGRIYGQLPKSTDMENLENEDYCAVCQKDGDLLCCDGCTSSIHRECIGISKYTELPDGQWYCPECRQVDGAKYGTLDGGRKARLEWYTPRVDYPNEEYLVVGGFAFRRPKDPLALQKEGGQDKGIPPPEPMSLVELKEDFKKFGPFTTAEWPLVQLPVARHMLWGGVRREDTYFKESRSYDPNSYKSCYQRAPLDGALRKVKEPQFSNFEYRCHQLSANAVSSKIIPSMDCDDYLFRGFENDVSGDLAFQMIRGYMIQLERNLKKAYMLEESWGLTLKTPKRSERTKADWSALVSKSSSANRLSRLLVQLVDATHPLVFTEEFFHCPNVKKSSTKETETLFKLAPMAKPELLLCQKRRWERVTAGNVQMLLAREKKRLVDWISEMRPDQSVQQRGSKRKKGGPSASIAKDDDAALVDESAPPEKAVGNPSDSKQSSSTISTAASAPSKGGEVDAKIQKDGEAEGDNKNATNSPTKDEDTISVADTSGTENDSTTQTQPKRKSKSRRRSTRVSIESSSDCKEPVSEEVLKTEILGSMKSVLREVPEPLIEGRAPDHFWPIAGRVPFDPVGRLPVPEIKRLARNAGSVHAHAVHYSSQFEVGQVSFFHIWRKRALLCENPEELMHLIRVLQSFMDNGVVSRAASCARMIIKSGFQAMAQIEASQRDVDDGRYFYLVKDVMSKWTWKSFRDVALNQLVHRKMCRRDKLVEKHRDIHRFEVEKKRKEDAVRLQAQRQKEQDKSRAIAAEQAAKRKAIEEEKAAKKKIRQDEIERKRAQKAADKARKDEEKARKAAERARKAEEDKRLADELARLRARRLEELRRKEAHEIAQIRSQTSQSQPFQNITLPSVAGLPGATYDSNNFANPNFIFNSSTPHNSAAQAIKPAQNTHQANLTQHIHSILRDHQVGFNKISAKANIRQEDLDRLRRTSLRRLGQMYSMIHPATPKQQIQLKCLDAVQKMEKMILSQKSQNQSTQTSSNQTGSGHLPRTQNYASGSQPQTTAQPQRTGHDPSLLTASQYASQPQVPTNSAPQERSTQSLLPTQDALRIVNNSPNSHFTTTTSPMRRGQGNVVGVGMEMSPQYARAPAQIQPQQSQFPNQHQQSVQNQYQQQYAHGQQQYSDMQPVQQHYGHSSGTQQSTAQSYGDSQFQNTTAQYAAAPVTNQWNTSSTTNIDPNSYNNPYLGQTHGSTGQSFSTQPMAHDPQPFNSGTQYNQQVHGMQDIYQGNTAVGETPATSVPNPLNQNEYTGQLATNELSPERNHQIVYEWHNTDGFTPDRNRPPDKIIREDDNTWPKWHSPS